MVVHGVLWVKPDMTVKMKYADKEFNNGTIGYIV
jgi:hypothetical protein